MRKYSSGFTLITILQVCGFAVVGLSLVVGVIFYANAPRGEAYLALIFAIAGSVQGLIILGIGSIGEAILDGSVSQQRTEHEIGRLLEEVRANKSFEDSISNAVNSNPNFEKRGGSISRVKNYKGYEIFKNGKIFYIKGVDGVYANISDAERWVDEKSHLLKRD